MIDLEYATKKINQLREVRKELHYTGRADLDCLRQIDRIRNSVTEELKVVRAKLEVCPAGMIADLKKQEEALLEWKRKNG